MNIKFGDIINIGEGHKLMWGDASNKECVNKLIDNDGIDLILTDPPYNLNIVKNNGTVGTSAKPGFKDKGIVGCDGVVKANVYKKILNDDVEFDPSIILGLDTDTIIFGANNFCHKLPINYKWLVWFKKSKLDEKFNNFSDCELMWTNLKGTAIRCYHHTWSSMVRQGSRRLELKKRVHPTQKPVGLLMDIIDDYTSKGDTVLDLYGGSGSTLIACEETGRKCYMMELDNEYCDLIISRFNNYYYSVDKCK